MKECGRIVDKYNPHKAQPLATIKFTETWGKLTDRQRGITAVMLNMGLRSPSIVGIDLGHFAKVSEEEVGTIICDDKVQQSANRNIRTRCTCGKMDETPNGEDLCPVHSPYINRYFFPIKPTEAPETMKAFGLSGHSSRRTMALTLRIWDEEAALLDIDKMGQRLGWVDRKRAIGYASVS